jgi:hypothetical protein
LTSLELPRSVPCSAKAYTCVFFTMGTGRRTSVATYMIKPQKRCVSSGEPDTLTLFVHFILYHCLCVLRLKVIFAKRFILLTSRRFLEAPSSPMP